MSTETRYAGPARPSARPGLAPRSTRRCAKPPAAGHWPTSMCVVISMAALKRSLRGAQCTPPMTADTPAPLSAPTLVDTAVWTWVRDRRRPDLANWFNHEVTSGRILVCDLVIVELIRLAPNSQRARDVAERLAAFASVPMPGSLWH